MCSYVLDINRLVMHTGKHTDTHTNKNTYNHTNPEIHIQTNIPVHIQANIQGNIQTHIQTHVQKHTQTNIQTHTHTLKHMHTNTHIQTHTYKHTHTNTHIQTNTNTHKQTLIQTHTYKHTHTNTHTRGSHCYVDAAFTNAIHIYVAQVYCCACDSLTQRKCCGVRNYTDWIGTPWYNNQTHSNESFDYPESCCPHNNCTREVVHFEFYFESNSTNSSFVVDNVFTQVWLLTASI